MAIKTRITIKDLPKTNITGVTGLTDGTFVGDGRVDILIEAMGTKEIDVLGLGVKLDDLTFAQGKEAKIVTHKDLPDVVLTMSDIERIIGTDKALAFDVSGNAGEVYAMLAAAFGKDDVTSNLMGKFLSMKDTGISDADLAKKILASTEYKEDALGTSNETFVKQMYKNIVGAAPSFADLMYFTVNLDNGTFTQSQLLDVASNLETFRTTIDLVGYVNTGIEYIPTDI